jgi:hypothetical protein
MPESDGLDLVFRNARSVDGRGAPATVGDVRVLDGRLVEEGGDPSECPGRMA